MFFFYVGNNAIFSISPFVHYTEMYTVPAVLFTLASIQPSHSMSAYSLPLRSSAKCWATLIVLCVSKYWYTLNITRCSFCCVTFEWTLWHDKGDWLCVRPVGDNESDDASYTDDNCDNDHDNDQCLTLETVGLEVPIESRTAVVTRPDHNNFWHGQTVGQSGAEFA